MSLRKQGADKGAVSAFLIATPESGIDSIAVTYALMDPIMTAARPVAAFVTATAAGLTENLISKPVGREVIVPDLSCPIDNCCDGVDCDPVKHRSHHTLFQKIRAGFQFAFGELWEDMAGWFFIGLLLAGIITGFVPDDLMTRYLGGGLLAMLIMLGAGIPLYICATASTPIAAALILKGVSPGAALVFLLAGPATNITSLTVLFGTLGKRSTAIYLGAIAVFSVACGLALDWAYGYFGWTITALTESPKELLPDYFSRIGVFLLLTISIKPVARRLSSLWQKMTHRRSNTGSEPVHAATLGVPSPLTKGCKCEGPT